MGVYIIIMDVVIISGIFVYYLWCIYCYLYFVLVTQLLLLRYVCISLLMFYFSHLVYLLLQVLIELLPLM